MTLITIAGPRPVDRGGHAAEGMVLGKTDLTPGTPPPFLVPHCWQCQEMVDRFTLDFVSSVFNIGVQFTCHGRTSGLNVSYLDVLRAGSQSGILWVFKEKTHAIRRK